MVQDAVQVGGPILVGSFSQTLAQLFRTLRPGEKSIEKGPQVEASASDHDGRVAALLDLLERLARLTRILSRSDVGGRLNDVEQMMRGAGTFFAAGLRSADLEFAIHRDRVAIDDFALKTLREGERKSRLAAGGGTENDDQ